MQLRALRTLTRKFFLITAFVALIYMTNPVGSRRSSMICMATQIIDSDYEPLFIFDTSFERSGFPLVALPSIMSPGLQYAGNRTLKWVATVIVATARIESPPHRSFHHSIRYVAPTSCFLGPISVCLQAAFNSSVVFACLSKRQTTLLHVVCTVAIARIRGTAQHCEFSRAYLDV